MHGDESIGRVAWEPGYGRAAVSGAAAGTAAVVATALIGLGLLVLAAAHVPRPPVTVRSPDPTNYGWPSYAEWEAAGKPTRSA